jgi:hypothetical protein
MPLLPYCVLLTKSSSALPEKGVGGTLVQSKICGRLTTLYSEMETSQITSVGFQRAALEFHHVVHGAFANAAVIPFRFPTWLTTAELSSHLEKESERYQSFLIRHASDVQMELRLAHATGATQQASTGTEHLHARAARLHEVEDAARELKQLLGDQVQEWRERDIPEGKRLYALVERTRVTSFREKLSGRTVRWSGPWPATEFLV